MFPVNMALGTGVILSLCAIFSAFLTQSWANRADFQEDQIKVSEFDVKPGGVEHSHQLTWVRKTIVFLEINSLRMMWNKIQPYRAQGLNQNKCDPQFWQ